MHQVVLHVLHLAPERRPQLPRERLRAPLALALVADAVQDQRQVRPPRHHEAELAPQVRARILVQRNLRHLPEPHPALPQAIADRLGRKLGPVLDSPEAFFLRRRHEHAVAHQAGRSIAVVGVEAEDEHYPAKKSGPEPNGTYLRDSRLM